MSTLKGIVGGLSLAAFLTMVSPAMAKVIEADKHSLFSAVAEARAILANEGLPEGGIEISLAPGVYRLSQAVILDQVFAGTAAAPIRLRAKELGSVWFSGSRPIDQWQTVTRATAPARLPAAAIDQVLVADLNALGITEWGEITPLAFDGTRYDYFGRRNLKAAAMLLQDGEWLTLARWPNQGYTRITYAEPELGMTTFRYTDPRRDRWQDEPALWFHGYFGFDWSDAYMPVVDLGLDDGEIVLGLPITEFPYQTGNRFYAFNALVELDAPGEYYLDREQGKLFVWPQESESVPQFELTQAATLLDLTQTRHVTISGINFEASRGDAVIIEGGHHNVIEHCHIRNIAGAAVMISGRDSGIRHCNIHDVGEGGVRLSGGDRQTLEPGNLFADHNEMTRVNRRARTYKPAIYLLGAGNRARHNHLHRLTHTAIMFRGNDFLIENNNIHDVVQDTEDAGAMYIGRDWTERGTVIRGNRIANVLGIGDAGVTQYGARGVYLDDHASGILVEGNIFINSQHCVEIGGGRDNIIRHNIFIDCESAVIMDARGLTWRTAPIADPNSTLNTFLRSVPYDRPPYSDRYRNLANLPEDEPAKPKYNEVTNNIQIRAPLQEREGFTPQYQRIEENVEPNGLQLQTQPALGSEDEKTALRAAVNYARDKIDFDLERGVDRWLEP